MLPNYIDFFPNDALHIKTRYVLSQFCLADRLESVERIHRVWYWKRCYVVRLRKAVFLRVFSDTQTAAQYYVDEAYCYRPSSVVCLSV